MFCCKISIPTLQQITKCYLLTQKLSLQRQGLIEPRVSFSCRPDSKCSCSFNPHDVLHHVCSGVFVPGLHPVLCAEGVLHNLRHHIRAELHSSYHQLQTTSLLEWGLETATAAQAGLTTWQTLNWQSEVPFSIKFILQQFGWVFFCFFFFNSSQQTLSLRILNWFFKIL